MYFLHSIALSGEVGSPQKTRQRSNLPVNYSLWR